MARSKLIDDRRAIAKCTTCRLVTNEPTIAQAVAHFEHRLRERAELPGSIPWSKFDTVAMITYQRVIKDAIQRTKS